MILACLLDLGFPEKELQTHLNKLSVPLSFQVKTVERGGIQSKQILPEIPKNQKKHSKLSDFLKIIKKSGLSKNIKKKSSNLFQKLAEAEGKIHGKRPEEVRFHELGGYDTLFDIIGITAGLEYFKPSKILTSPLHVGKGFVKTSHGILPVPPPVVLELLKNFPIYSGTIEEELVTPTGALIISSFTKPSPGIPNMILKKTGCGAGTKILSIPNILRILMGELSSEKKQNKTLDPRSEKLQDEDEILKLETNIDDMNPQLWDYIIEKLYAAGAYEVFLTPVIMKKSRPANLLTVLASVKKESQLTELIFSETTTLGIRKEMIKRKILNRTIQEINTPYGRIQIKISNQNGKILNLTPEYEALKKIAQKKKIPLKKLYHDVFALLYKTKLT
jgi:uncharacterized protein (TIGR00299 family) protein